MSCCGSSSQTCLSLGGSLHCRFLQGNLAYAPFYREIQLESGEFLPLNGSNVQRRTVQNRGPVLNRASCCQFARWDSESTAGQKRRSTFTRNKQAIEKSSGERRRRALLNYRDNMPASRLMFILFCPELQEKHSVLPRLSVSTPLISQKPGNKPKPCRRVCKQQRNEDFHWRKL